MQPSTAVSAPRTAARSGSGRRRLAAGAAVVAVIALLVAAHLTGSSAAAATTTWKTVWIDNFSGPSGSAPSSANWRYDIGPGSNYGTGEIETTTDKPANVSLDGNGDLKITAIRDASGHWTSGRIETNRDDFQPAAGAELQVSARIRIPAKTGAAGAGYWPAFWMLGTRLRNGGTWPDIGEFDILEDVNGQNLVYGTLHCGVNPGGPCQESNGLGGHRACPATTCTGKFHTYSLQWDRRSSPEQLRWYVDGTQYWSVSSNQVDAKTWNDATHRSAFIILDLAMGGGFPNGVAGMTTPTASTQSNGPMLVDYVEVQTS